LPLWKVVTSPEVPITSENSWKSKTLLI